MLSLFIFLFVVSACKKKGSGGAEVSLSTQVNEMGQNVYRVNCASCHGPSGEGDGPATMGFYPRNFKKDKFKNGANMIGIRKTLSEGIPGTQMVAWEGVLSKAQIEAVAEYILSLIPSRKK